MNFGMKNWGMKIEKGIFFVNSGYKITMFLTQIYTR